MSKIISGISVFLTGLLPASCHHHTATATSPTTTNSTTAITAPLPGELGAIMLTNHVEYVVPLGNGKDCILVPKLEDKKNSSIVVTFETKNANGKVHDMSVAQVEVKNGDPAEVTVGDFHITFTPTVVDDQ